MVTWRPDDGHHHYILDRWRVSSLIRAFLETVLALCVLLCAIICVTTTRLLKSSGLFHQTCVLCDIQQHKHGHRQGCTNGCVSDHTIWAIDDDDSCRRKRRGGSCCSSLENVDSCCDGGSDHIGIDGTTVAAAMYGCECRRCIGIPGGSSPPSSSVRRRAVKRKFANVFPHDAREGSCSPCCCEHPARYVFADSASSIFSEGGGPAEIGESADDDGGLVHTAGSTSRFLSDGSDAQRPRRFAPEDSERVSCQESFSYNTRRSPPGGLSRCAEVPRNRSMLSMDTDFLGGESTPEWGGSLDDSPVVGNEKEMEEEEEEEQQQEAGSTVQHEDELTIGAMELREALQEEEGFAAVYLELEEERNAASSAAHEAMAMITRLQEEKAAIQMEARQYQRMAEEKHDYDQESMAMLQEILVRRDEELYALEEEVNLYRNRLLTSGRDEIMDQSGGGAIDRVESPRSANDVLVIERETLLLDGSEDWKNRRDRADQTLLAEIKEWLHEAVEKVAAPEKIEELKLPPGISHNIRLLPGSGRKNLLESFRSVGVEGGESDGIALEEFEARKDEIRNEELEARKDEIADEEPGTHIRNTGAGYESFQGMMESLRREPSMRDEESLKTLKKIEEKFHRQSSLGEIRRSGDELRQIWKNTLRSLESDEHEDTEARGAGAEQVELKAENPITAVEPPTTCDSPDHNEVTDSPPVDGDRTVGEKRMSVLEYVWKFEEQLHHLDNKKPPLSGKSGSLSAVETVPEATPESKCESSDLGDTDKNKKPNWARLRKLPAGSPAISRAADGRSATPDAERDRFAVRGEAASSRERATRAQDVKSEMSPDFKERSNQDGSSVVHDVYEVQQDPGELPMEASFHDRKDKRYDIKKYVSSTVSELIPGQFVDSQETARCVEHYLFDNGRQDVVTGHALEEYEANGKGRPDQNNSAGDCRLSVKEAGMCAQADEWPGDCMDMSPGANGCTLQSPSSAVSDAPRTQMQDLVRQLTNRLKALETDRQMMQNTITSLKRENGEMKILQDIAQQLREVRGGMEQPAVNNTDTWPPDDPAFVSSIKGMLSLDSLRHSVKSQLSKLVQVFLGNGNRGGSQADQHVGLFRLLHKSPLSKQEKPIERARSLKAEYATNHGPLDAQFQPSTPTLVSHHSWPKDAKERSGTAFSGWDL